jgi:hypothetical protein
MGIMAMITWGADADIRSIDDSSFWSALIQGKPLGANS